jgi:hypothetical protein
MCNKEVFHSPYSTKSIEGNENTNLLGKKRKKNEKKKGGGGGGQLYLNNKDINKNLLTLHSSQVPLYEVANPLFHINSFPMPAWHVTFVWKNQ